MVRGAICSAVLFASLLSDIRVAAFAPLKLVRRLKIARSAESSTEISPDLLSTVDGVRLELPYDDACEQLLNSWLTRAQKSSEIHDSAGYHFKALHRKYELPPIILNLCLAPASVLLGNVHMASLDAALGGGVSVGTLVTSLLTLCAGILAGIGSFNDAKTKSNQHFDISARYFDICTDIETELIKPRHFRIPADVFLAKTQQQIDSANARAPVIPRFLLSSPPPSE